MYMYMYLYITALQDHCTIPYSEKFSWPQIFADPSKNEFRGFNFHGFLLFGHLQKFWATKISRYTVTHCMESSCILYYIPFSSLPTDTFISCTCKLTGTNSRILLSLTTDFLNNLPSSASTCMASLDDE